MANTESTATRIEYNDLTITRVFNAPREMVFKAWTECEHFKKWWGPKEFTTPFCEIDLRVGGLMRFSMKGPDGSEVWCAGVYQEIVKPERIVCTDTFTDKMGNKAKPADYGLPPEWPEEQLVKVLLVDEDGQTRMTMIQTDVPMLPFREMAFEGWSQSFDKLEEYLARQQ